MGNPNKVKREDNIARHRQKYAERMRRKREREQERDDAAQSRTPQEQLAKLDRLGLTATKERGKLQKRIEENSVQ